MIDQMFYGDTNKRSNHNAFNIKNPTNKEISHTNFS